MATNETQQDPINAPAAASDTSAATLRAWRVRLLTEQLDDAKMRLTQAEHELEEATDRAEYYGWRGEPAQREHQARQTVKVAGQRVRRLNRALRRAERGQFEEGLNEGIGAFAWGLLALLIAATLAAALIVLPLTTHGLLR